jgi:predicted MFS family arabinose efflux permease
VITAVGGGFVLTNWLRRPSLKTFILSLTLLGTSLLFSASSPTVMWFPIGMPYFGAVIVPYTTVAQTVLQQNTPNSMQGRIMSLFSLGTMGTTPIGALVSGWLTDAVFPRASLAVGDVAPVACGVWIWPATRSGKREKSREMWSR